MLPGDAAILFSFCYVWDFAWLWFEGRRCFAIYVIRGDGNKGKDIHRRTHGPDRHSQKRWCWAEAEVRNTDVGLL